MGFTILYFIIDYENTLNSYSYEENFHNTRASATWESFGLYPSSQDSFTTKILSSI